MTATLLDPTDAALAPDELHRFTVKEYLHLVKIGTLTDEDRVELLEGMILEKMPHNAPHDHVLSQLHMLLVLLLGREWIVRCQGSMTFSRSVPEPDIAVVPGPAKRFARVRPTWENAELLVEVADSSLRRDRGLKLRIYAEAKVPVYWIVNVAAGVVEVYTQPRAGKYLKRTDYQAADEVPVVLAKKTVGGIPASEFLP